MSGGVSAAAQGRPRRRTVPEDRFVMVKTAPPPPGDELCAALTGMTEAEFVREILGRREMGALCGTVHTASPAG